MGKFILMCYVFSFGIFFSLLGTGYLIIKIAERVRKRRPRTHADMIRSMSDEELAYGIAHGFEKPTDMSSPWCNLYCNELDSVKCGDCILEWLKKEANDEL